MTTFLTPNHIRHSLANLPTLTFEAKTDSAQISYIQTLQKNWQRYYQIRKLTLFDYETGKKVE